MGDFIHSYLHRTSKLKKIQHRRVNLFFMAAFTNNVDNVFMLMATVRFIEIEIEISYTEKGNNLQKIYRGVIRIKRILLMQMKKDKYDDGVNSGGQTQ